jgi:hypothetical protein
MKIPTLVRRKPRENKAIRIPINTRSRYLLTLEEKKEYLRKRNAVLKAQESSCPFLVNKMVECQLRAKVSTPQSSVLLLDLALAPISLLQEMNLIMLLLSPVKASI